MIEVTDTLSIPESEVVQTFMRASGPGGQKVNKVSTAVQLRFDVRASKAISPRVKERLLRLAGARANSAGVIVLNADRFRTQGANRRDARARLAELVRNALSEPKSRIPTAPTRSSKKRRVDDKKRRSRTKSLRSAKISLDS